MIDEAGRDDELKPPTDEFGRADPDVLEREARREERERRRAAQAELGGKVGKTSKSRPRLGGRRKSKAPPPSEAPPPSADPSPAPEPTPAPELAASDGVGPTGTPSDSPVARTSISARAGAGLDAVRSRIGSAGKGRSGGDGKPPKPPKPPKAPRSPAFRRRRLIALGATLIGLLAAWFLIALFQPFAGDGKGSGTVSVSIPEGADAGQIADVLDQNGVVTSGQLFQIRLKLSGKADDVQAGDYALAKGMSYSTAIDRLTGNSNGEQMLLIPEGFSRPQIAEKVAADGISGDYEAASVSQPGFDPAAYGAKNPANLEGFLFPATYDLPQGSTATDLVTQQLAAFKQNIKGVDMSYARKKNLTVYDVLTIASMVERETSQADERALVAAVIYNRLKRGQPLGIDATTRFETGNYGGELTGAQLRADTPYNTRTNVGLPPGPIGNPGLDSIKAAAHPANVPYLYYVVKPGTCGHTFVNTEAEFNAAVAKYNAARDAAGGSSPTNC